MRALDLKAITNEWLSLTMDPASRSVSSTPVPPTPPPLPHDFTPFTPRPQRSTAPSPSPSYRDFTSPPPALSRTHHIVTNLTPTSPPPTPHSHFTHTPPLPNTLLPHSNRNISQPKSEVLSSTRPQFVKTPSPVPQWHKPTTREDKEDPPLVKPQIKDHFQTELKVKDPYDELLFIILSCSSSTEEVDDSRLLPKYHPPPTHSQTGSARSGLKTPQPKEEVRCSSGLAGRICLDLHSPVTVKPLSELWDAPAEFERPPSIKGRAHTELFIEEEEDKEEEFRVLNERLSPQAEVCAPSPTCLSNPSPPCRSTTSPPPLATHVPASSPSLLPRPHPHNPSPTTSPRPPSLPQLSLSPLPVLSPCPSPSPPASPAPPRSASQPPPLPCHFHPVQACPVTGSPVPLHATSPPLPLSSPRCPPIGSHVGRRSPMVKRLVQDALHGGGDPYQALYNYMPRNEDELELREGDVVDVMEKCDDGWFVGTSRRSKLFGTFPGNYVKQL